MRGNGPDQSKEAGGSALTVDPAARSGKLAFYPSTARFLLRGGLDCLLGLGSRLLLLPRLGKQCFCGAVRTDSNSFTPCRRRIIHLLLQALDLGVILGLDLVQLLFPPARVSPSLEYPDGTRCVTSGGAVLPVGFVVPLLFVGVEAGASACVAGFAWVVCDFAVLLSWAPRESLLSRSVIAAALATTATDRRARDIMTVDLS